MVRGAFAVAEAGSVCLTDEVLGVNTLGYLPQHLIVLLDPADTPDRPGQVHPTSKGAAIEGCPSCLLMIVAGQQ